MKSDDKHEKRLHSLRRRKYKFCLLVSFALILSVLGMLNASIKFPSAYFLRSRDSTSPNINASLSSYIIPSEVIPNQTSPNSTQNFEYKLKNVFLSLELLKTLEPVVNASTINFEGVKPSKFLPAKDRNFCEGSREFFFSHPEEIFGSKNFYYHYHSTLLRPKVLKVIGKDVHPNSMSRKLEPNSFHFSPEINCYYILNLFSLSLAMNKHYACSHQLLNQIFGVNSLYGKSNVDRNYKKYKSNYSHMSECAPVIMLDSYLLKDKGQCKEFFNYIKNENYTKEKREKGIVFAQKAGFLKHAGNGVHILDDPLEQNLMSTYKNGALCGEISKDLQMQHYLSNPFLLHGHKFDFRVFMIVASTNPLIAYYHDGFLRVSLYQYNLNSTERAMHLTNTHLSKEFFEIARKNGTWNGMNETELRDFQTWTFPRLQEYLISTGRIPDAEAMETIVRGQLKTAMVHLLRATQHSFYKRSNLFQLLGLDFLMDDNLKLWFIEANLKPGIQGSSKDREKFFVKMCGDMFEVVFSYLRSRMKRVIGFMNNLTNKITQENPNFIPPLVADWQAVQQEYDNINQNYLEKEFEVSPENGFVKIVDENLSGKKRYSGLVPEQCL